MMKTLYRCRNASVSEEFAGRRQFVREWEPRFVGLLRNVLSCRRKDDIPTQLPVDEVLTQESQSLETVIDDIMTDVNVLLRMEDGRVEACLIWESTGIASCIQVRKENLEITRTQQYIDSNLVPVQIGVQPKSMDKSKHGKDARNESSEKVKDDDQRKCYHCRGYAKSQSRTRLKDLIDAEWKPMTANIRPSSTAADAPLTDDYVTMFLVTMPHAKRKSPCARVKIETTMRSDASSTAPTGSGRVRLTSAIPTCKTCLMMDTCAGGGICPKGSDRTAQRDTTVTTQSVTAMDDSAHGNVDETHFENHKFQARCNEADVGFIMSSAGKTSQQSDWFESDGGYQVMLPGPGEQTRTCVKDSNVAKLEENRRVHWLPGSAAESTDGAPLTMKFRVARLVVEATTDSETEFDESQLEESEETRRLKHKTILRHVNGDEDDTRQIAHLQSRTRSGETVDQAHRPQAGTHEGEDRRGKDHLFLSNATDPQHVKAVLNRLESEAAFSAMSVNRVEARLVGACEAFRPTNRTRLITMRAVRNPVCDAPKAPSANAERIERASQKVEKRFRTSRSWFEGISVERVCKVMPDTVCNCAWQTSRRLARPGRAKQNEASRRHNGQVSKFTKMNHFTDDEWNLRLWRDAVMVSSGHWKGKLVRVCGCRIVWRSPENQRWDRKMLTEMNGEPRTTLPRQEEKLQIKDRDCIALKHLIKWRVASMLDQICGN